jgi:hypothetical protein
MPSYVAAPSLPARWPGVIVIHDYTGMSQDLRNQADWLASEGFPAAAPDLYYWGSRLRCLRTIMRDISARRGSVDLLDGAVTDFGDQYRAVVGNDRLRAAADGHVGDDEAALGVDLRDGVGQNGDVAARLAQCHGDGRDRRGEGGARGHEREAAATSERRVRAEARTRPVERGVLCEDRLLELAQLPPRLDPQLFDERAPRFTEALQRVRLATRPVEREHVLRAQALAQRVLAHEPLELGYQLDVTTETEVGVDALFDRRTARSPRRFDAPHGSSRPRYRRRRAHAPIEIEARTAG